VITGVGATGACGAGLSVVITAGLPDTLVNDGQDADGIGDARGKRVCRSYRQVLLGVGDAGVPAACPHDATLPSSAPPNKQAATRTSEVAEVGTARTVQTRLESRQGIKGSQVVPVTH